MSSIVILWPSRPQIFIIDCSPFRGFSFSFFKPVYTLDCCGWQIQGDWLGWDYEVTDGSGRLVMQLSKELLHFSDTYVLDIQREEDTLLCLMIVLSIDAANCSDD